MVRHFLERFELWRRERAEQRRDNSVGWLLFFAAVVIAQDAYALVTTQYLTWHAIVGSALILAFVVLHIRQSPWTWVILMVLGAVALIQVPALYAVRFFSAGFAAAIGIAAIVYSLIIRKRFARDTRTI